MRLISCALTDKPFEQPARSASEYDDLFTVANQHSMSALVAYSLRRLKLPVPESFRLAYGTALRRYVLMNQERKAILSDFESRHIRYLPMKGIILQTYYPAVGIREMSDNDILIDRKDAMLVSRIMKDRGYSVRSYGKGHHDTYLKNGGLVFEIHRSLTDELDWKAYAEYYRSVFDRCQKDDENRYGYHFSSEDYYIFHIIHAKIHFDIAGIGLRTLVDLFVLQRHFGDSIDKAYINRELAALGADSFEEQLVHTMQSVFFGEQDDIEDNEILDYLIFSGTYGTNRNLLDNRIDRAIASRRKGVRLYYLKDRFHTPESMLHDKYPFIYRHRWLEPVLWVYRPVKKIVKRPRSVVTELKRLNEKTKNRTKE